MARKNQFSDPIHAHEQARIKSESLLQWGLAIPLLFSLVFFGSYYNTRRQPDQALVAHKKITIAQFGDVFLYAPLYIAKDAGFFKQRGLEVTFVSTGGDEKTWAAVVSQNALVGVADPTFVAISSQEGLPGVVIASIIAKAPFWGITNKKGLKQVTSPKDLKGLSVATFPAPSTAYTLQRRMFQLGGLPPNIREGAFGSLIAMLKAGTADIALEIEPNVTQSTLDGFRIVYGMDKIYGVFQTTGVTTLPETIQKKPEELKAVVCSIADAMNFIRNNHEESVSLMTKRFPEIKREIASLSLKRMVETGVIPSTPAIKKNAWDQAISLRNSVGDLKASGSFDEFVDNTFADSCSNAN